MTNEQKGNNVNLPFYPQWERPTKMRQTNSKGWQRCRKREPWYIAGESETVQVLWKVVSFKRVNTCVHVKSL